MKMKNYIIHKDTLAILPAKQLEYDSIAIERKQTLHIKQTPMNIMKESCITYLADYNGRRNAVMHLTGHKERIVIPIHPSERIIFFPTHGTRHIDCSWIAYEHVLYYEAIEQQTTKVVFKNMQAINVPISFHSFETQMMHSYEILQHINKLFPK